MPKHISVSIDGEKLEDKKEFSKYEVEDAIRCIMQAEEVLENKALMKEVSKKINQAHKKVNSISDIRKLAEKPNFGMDDGEETEDDKAEKESKEARVKNSKNPTVVGKVMK